jgi:cytochrome o ubiquinol oxidase subunit 2
MADWGARSPRPDCGGRAHYSTQRDSDHARGDRAGHRAYLGCRLVVPGRQRQGALSPDWSYSGRIEVVVWSIPTLVVSFLGGIAWIGSHDLDPRVAIRSEAPPIQIEVVSMDWKWLFIYPDMNVASVNRLVVPAGAPISFRLTSASVMNSFFVPQLGSQIYAMHGMTTRLNLQADLPGTYPGLSAQFSGAGFSDMRFEVVALPKEGFEEWLKTARSSGGTLDAQATLSSSGQAQPWRP